MTDEPRIPTFEDMQAIAEAAAKSAVEAASTDRGEAGKAGAKAEAEARGLSLPDEILEKIGGFFEDPSEFIRMFGDATAAATIAQLEERGAFQGDETETPPETGEGGNNPPETGGDPAGGAEQVTQAGKTFAEKYLGM